MGHIPAEYYAHFLLLNSWIIDNDKLYYVNKYAEQPKQVDPKELYLYTRIGTGPLDVDTIRKNPSYWNLYASSPKNEVYESLKEQLVDKVQIIDLSIKFPFDKHKSINRIENPLFKRTQYYWNDSNQTIFSDLKLVHLK